MPAPNVCKTAHSLQALHTEIWYEPPESQHCLHPAVNVIIHLTLLWKSTKTTRVESSKNMVSSEII